MKNRPHNNYANNVFINCPFDDEFKPLFRSMVFAIQDCGFIPRCSQEGNDGADVRIQKILNIITECKYGIHDISKADLDRVTGLARFNMPLELGLFWGAIRYSPPGHFNKEKKIMIMDIERYRYRDFISDISGQDIKEHGGEEEKAISNIRTFLYDNSRRLTIASGNFYIERFAKFNNELPTYCQRLNWDIGNLSFLEYSELVKQWIEINPY